MISFAEHDNISEIVIVHQDSFSGFFLSFLGTPFLSLYYCSILDAPEGILYVMSHNGKIEGFVAGCTRPQGFYRRLLKKKALQFAIAALPAILSRPSILPRLFRAFRHPASNPVGDDVAGLFSIGISSSCQGGGRGRALVSIFLDESKQRGCKRVFLTTDRDDNAAVNAFYTSLGFEVERTYTTPEGRNMNEYWITL